MLARHHFLHLDSTRLQLKKGRSTKHSKSPCKLWMISMPMSAPSMAAQSTALTSSPTSHMRNSRRTTSAPKYPLIMHPNEDSCKLHLQRCTQPRLKQTGEESTPPRWSTKDPADLAGTHANVYRSWRVPIYLPFTSFFFLTCVTILYIMQGLLCRGTDRVRRHLGWPCHYLHYLVHTADDQMVGAVVHRLLLYMHTCEMIVTDDVRM